VPALDNADAKAKTKTKANADRLIRSGPTHLRASGRAGPRGTTDRYLNLKVTADGKVGLGVRSFVVPARVGRTSAAHFGFLACRPTTNHTNQTNRTKA